MGVLEAVGGWLVKSGQSLSTTDKKAGRIWSRVLGGGGESDAGEAVTVDVALQLATAWACIRLVSETVATLPFMLYRDDGDGKRVVARDDPLYGLIHDQPNADSTAVEFWEGLIFCLLTWGNAYAEKVFIGTRLVALLPLRTDWMKVTRDANGARVYRYGDPKGMREMSEDEVFHVRGFGNGGDTGLSPILYGRQTFGSARAADKAAAKMFANGVRPSGVLQVEKILTSEQRKDVRENIIDPFSGVMNAGGVFLLEGGMNFSPVTLSPEASQMLQTRSFHVEEICRWFGVPPVLIGHSSSGQTMWGSGVEQIMLGWFQLGLRNILKRIEASVKRSLIPAERRSVMHPEFNIDGLLRADSKTRQDLFASYVQNGIRSRNEIRKLDNLPPYEGGDVYTAQTNLAPVDKLGMAVATKSAVVEGGGPTGHSPFDGWKAFDPSKHPRGPDGRWRGSGGSGRRSARLARLTLERLGFIDDVELGRVSGKRFSKAAGRDVDGWRFNLTSEGVRHANSRHGIASADRNPIRASDFENLPRTLQRGTVVKGGTTRRESLQTIIVTHPYRGVTYRAVLTVRKRNRTLTLHTFSRE